MSDTPLSVVQDELRKGLRVFRAFQGADQLITDLQTAEQRQAEAEATLAALQPKIASAQQHLATAEAGIEHARAEAVSVADSIKQACEAEVLRAKTEAATLLADAKEEANTLLATATRKAKDADARADKAEARIATTAAALAELEGKLEAAKAHVAKLLG